MTEQVVAVIPAGVTLDTAGKAMEGMRLCYPHHALSLTNDHAGGMVIVRGERTGDDPPPEPGIEISLGETEPGDLLAFAFTGEPDHRQALAAMATALAKMLEDASAPNYLTMTFDLPDDTGRYGFTIQRCGGKTPEQHIRELKAQLSGEPLAVSSWPPPWTLKPVHSDPEMIIELTDDEERPLPPTAHWSVGFGFALNAGHCDGDPDGPLTIDGHFSDDDLARGMCRREVAPDQLDRFADMLHEVAGHHRRIAAEAAGTALAPGEPLSTQAER